jgi:PKD domain
MSPKNPLRRKILAGILLTLSVASLAFLSLPSRVSAVPTGSYFNHIVIIAMENQYYTDVIGSSSAPFINSLAASGSTISNYHSYGQNIGGCSAGCYEAFTSGQQSHSDGWCSSSASPCVTIPNIADQLHSAGLTSAMFCEDGCPREADHFPWIGYTSTWNSCMKPSFTCSGQTGPDGNLLYDSSSSNGNQVFINYLNSANPANYIWFTPNDNNNMHSSSVATGDAYIQQLLVGSGTISSPASGSVLASNLFSTPGTFLYLWWDEYDPSPNVEYGSMVKAGYTSTGGYTEYNSLHTIEANWGLPYLTSVVSGDASMSDIFGSGSGMTASFSANPSAPAVGAVVTFTGSASGGTAPYTYSWNFGDGSTATGASPTHSFARGSYSITMTATDANGKTATTAQSLNVGGTTAWPGLTPVSTALFVIAGLLAMAVAVTFYLAHYRAGNRRLTKRLANN